MIRSATRSAFLLGCAIQLCACTTPKVLVEESEPAGMQARVLKLAYLKQLNAAATDVSATAAANDRGDMRNKDGANILEKLGTQQTWVGDVDGAIRTFDLQSVKRRLPKYPAISDAAMQGLQAEDAIKAIVEEARHRRVVIINESHHVPLHRAFSMKLARELRRIGYEYFAAETLSSQTDLPRQGVTLNSGAYTPEPVFGEFLRDIGRDGWKPIAYEADMPPATLTSPAEMLQYRETKQAQNLVNQVLKPYPEAKLLVHVGGWHGNKSTARSVKQMGAMLRELGNTEPLSVDQTSFFSHPDPAMEWTPYRALLAAKNINAPAVLKKADGKPFLFGVPADAFDMQVIHPAYGLVDGRAEWLMSIAGRSATEIPPSLLSKDKARLIYAFYRDDVRVDAIPVDTVLLLPGQAPPKLMLPNGRFRLEYEE